MIRPVLQNESTLTDRYQTTIPEAVRNILHLNKRDKIRYIVQPDGRVFVTKVANTNEDPVLGEYLQFLAKDIQKNPQHLTAISSELFHHIQTLTSTMDIDLDESLPDEIESN